MDSTQGYSTMGGSPSKRSPNKIGNMQEDQPEVTEVEQLRDRLDVIIDDLDSKLDNVLKR